MCLVLKLDNGKVISIAHEQTHRQTDRRTEPPRTALVYRCKVRNGFPKIRQVYVLSIQYTVSFNLLDKDRYYFNELCVW